MLAALAVLLFGAVPATEARAQALGGALAAVEGVIFAGEGETVLRPGAVHMLAPGSDGSWALVARLEAPEAELADGFGSAVAARLADGYRWLLVGAPGTGAAYLFRAPASAAPSATWSLAATLVPAEGSPSGRFGTAVALDPEGRTLAVGAPGGAGAVHLFRLGDDGQATPAGVLEPEGGGEGSAFGSALHFARERLFVGAPGHEDNRGSVAVYRPEATGWDAVTVFAPRGLAEGARFGTALATDGARVQVGAPGAREAGAVFIFQPGASGLNYNEAGVVVGFDGRAGDGFGTSLAAASGILWVGAPAALGGAGTLYRFQGEGFRYVAGAVIPVEGSGRGAALGGALVAVGEQVVAGLPGAARGAGAVQVLRAAVDGGWASAGRVTGEAETLPAIVGETLECGEDGRVARFFACQNVELLSFLPISDIGGEEGIRLNDTWGWHDEETGREVVLVGRTNGVAFVDITDPNHPVYLGQVLKTEGSPDAAWRDFKVFRDHAFIVADASGRHGMQVFNLRRLDQFAGEPITFEPDLTYDRIHSAHNIGLNEDTGTLFIVGASQGGETCGGGLHMVDANDPMNPTFLGCFADPRTGRTGTGYSHDVQCVTYHGPDERYTGREICMGSNETHLSVADVTDKANPVAVSIASYPNVGYVHQGWFDEEHRYFYMQDELALMQGLIDHTRTVIFDVSDLEDPQVVGEFFFDTRAVSHNLYIRGELMFEANYSSGLRIVDISDRENPVEVGWIDTAPTHAAEPMFEGAWSTYPYFRNGVVSVSSIGEGLFLVRFRDPRPVS